jgi:glucosamine-6-phosphate deaminase
MSQIATKQCELLPIRVYDTEQAMGRAAAVDAAACLCALQAQREEINIIFAAARSQEVFLDTLVGLSGIDWGRVNAFHMDEYAGLNWNDEKSLAWFLDKRYFRQLALKGAYFIDGRAVDGAAECARYQALLREHPADLVFLGIGDNGHLAFNDPHVADFSCKADVVQVDIDTISKQQQVNAGNFPSVRAVPSLAYTVTIPALMRARQVLCMAPTKAKAWAVGRALRGGLNEACPASILRRHRNAVLYLDSDSASALVGE